MLRILVFLSALAAPQMPVQTFEADLAGQPPSGFALATGGKRAPTRWVVRRDGTNQVVVHAGATGEADDFGVAVYEREQYQRVELSVRLKATGGSRTGGLVWKYQDPLNHYVVRLNLVTQELAVYRVVRGNRIRLEREDDLELDPDGWHTLRVVQDEDSMRIYLGGIRVFSERDRQGRGSGGVGLWAAGDADVSFDDFRAQTRTERQR